MSEGGRGEEDLFTLTLYNCLDMGLKGLKEVGGRDIL